MRLEACQTNPSALTNVIQVLWTRCLRQVQQCRYIKLGVKKGEQINKYRFFLLRTRKPRCYCMRLEACQTNPSALTNVIQVLWTRCLRQVQQCRYIKLGVKKGEQINKYSKRAHNVRELKVASSLPPTVGS
ncbi:hypothetical protein GLYMA_17G163300v4 [Glycine max]|nr:hypothetical protein GLYMA_17G163300v4 [Glycine max]KAG4379048.1 hypothetical protein GLYMA_17G163300v4 [Glycine max]KAH1118724.1 hypothetical protein GYH30_047484 [Glycine max]KAH1118725.1 hypothetical protein GYH30_047484 [Glycine max]